MSWRNIVLSLVTTLVLLASAVVPMTAHAQEPLPPPDEAATQEVPPPEGAATEEAPTTNELPTEEAPIAVEAATEAAEEAVTLPEVLQAAPAGTEVVVLDENGVALPLASNAAADALLVGDPMWCPGTAEPGDSSCTTPHASFADLLADLADDSEVGSGTIYVSNLYSVTDDGGADSGGIFFNWGDYALTDLVIQGGWDFGSNALNGTSSIGAQMNFINWGNPGNTLTLNDLDFINGGMLNIYDSIVDGTHADVILENVSVTGSNSDGAYIETTGDIEVNNSEFKRNKRDGLEVYADGSITLNNVTANANDENGVDGWALSDFTVNGGTYSRNYDNGLFAGADGNVTIENVIVKDNGEFGILSGALGNMTLNEIVADHNEIGGILAGAIGNATATGVRAADNGLLGVVVGALGDASLSDVTARYNGLIGAGVVALGDATLNNVLASYNDGVGAAALALGDVSITDVRTKENGYIGTAALAFGDVSLSNVIANGNGYVGVAGGSLGGLPIVPLLFGGLDLSAVPYAGSTLEEIDWYEATMTPAHVSFNDVTASGNGLIGGVAAAVGDVNVTGSIFNDNSLIGVLAVSGGNIYVGDSTFNGNGMLGVGGVSLLEGDVTIYRVNAIGNDGMGVAIGSAALELMPVFPFISGISPSETANVSLTCSVSTGNTIAGLFAGSDTTIAGNDLSGNGGGEYQTAFGAVVTEGTSPNCGASEAALSDYIMNLRAAMKGSGGVCSDITLSEGDVTAVFHELCGHDVGLEPPEAPGDLPSGATLSSQVTVIGDLPQPDAYVTVSFLIPAGSDPSSLEILFWDGTNWVAVPGGSQVDGKLVVNVEEAGIYAMVQQ